MAHLKFDITRLERLNDAGRFEQLDPDRMWEALGSPRPSAIVEIGAGTGLFSARFAELAPGAVVYAVDAEPAMVQWMLENREGVAEGRIVPVLSSESSIPLPSATADVVVMINVHHELADPDATYREGARLLKPGGRMLVVDWAPRETPKGPPQSVRASAETLEATLASAGMCDVVVHPDLEWHHMLTACRQPPERAGRECDCTR